jgi:hypothetical protein
VPTVWVYLGIAVYLVVPFRDIRRLLSDAGSNN